MAPNKSKITAVPHTHTLSHTPQGVIRHARMSRDCNSANRVTESKSRLNHERAKLSGSRSFECSATVLWFGCVQGEATKRLILKFDSL